MEREPIVERDSGSLGACAFTLEFLCQGNFNWIADDAFEILTGYQPVEATSLAFLTSVVPASDTAKLNELYFSVIGGARASAQHRLIRKDQREIWVQTTAMPIVSAAGNVIGMEGVICDISRFQENIEGRGAQSELNKATQAIYNAVALLEGQTLSGPAEVMRLRLNIAAKTLRALLLLQSLPNNLKEINFADFEMEFGNQIAFEGSLKLIFDVDILRYFFSCCLQSVEEPPLYVGVGRNREERFLHLNGLTFILDDQGQLRTIEPSCLAVAKEIAEKYGGRVELDLSLNGQPELRIFLAPEFWG